MWLSFLSVAFAADLSPIADGAWNSAPTAGPNGTIRKEANVWVDIAANNVGYGKRVGIRWTDDGWTTWQDADAWYEGSLGNNQEQWGVDIVPVGLWDTDGQGWKYRDWDGGWRSASSVEIEYAIWMSLGGYTWWESDGGANFSVLLTP